MENKVRNRFTFGFGTIGRDMVYSLISMYLIYYLTDVVELETSILWWVSIIMLICRVFDALNDPFMGLVVDNTKSKFGKFKPWILGGAFTSGILTILIFVDFKLTGMSYVLWFFITYLLWGIAYTTNDISYWSLLPALSSDQKEREKIGSIARIFANIGTFFVVAGIVPITNAFSKIFNSLQMGFLVFAIMVVTIMYLGQLVTLVGVKVPKAKSESKIIGLKDLVKVIFGNDQLVIVSISMVLFLIAYITTTSFGIYYFKYAYGDEGMYSVFAIVLGVSQLLTIGIFPLISKVFNRKKLYSGAMFLVTLGYVIFFAANKQMLQIGLAGVLLFTGQAIIQMLMLMFLADTVEYGEWKLGNRNESVTFSLQPLIYKMSGAIATAIVSVTIILSGIKDANTALEVSVNGLFMMKIAMFVIPLIFIFISFIIYHNNYKLDEKMYQKISKELELRNINKEKEFKNV